MSEERPPLGPKDLSPLDVDAETAERIRKTALDAFVAAHEVRDEPLIGRFLAHASRALVPALLVAVVGLYLSWAVTAATAVYR